MEENAKLVKSLLERAVDYGKTTYELEKLKLVDKGSVVAFSFFFHSVVFFLATISLLFISLGTAFWLGMILGKTFYGFLIVAGFYGITGIVFYLCMYKWLKKIVCNLIIKRILN